MPDSPSRSHGVARPRRAASGRWFPASTVHRDPEPTVPKPPPEPPAFEERRASPPNGAPAARPPQRATSAPPEREADDERAALRARIAQLELLLDASVAELHDARGELETLDAEVRELRDAALAAPAPANPGPISEAEDEVARAQAEAELIRREAHVTAQGIREIAREDAKNMKAAVEFFGLTVEVSARLDKIERALLKQRKLLKKLRD